MIENSVSIEKLAALSGPFLSRLDAFHHDLNTQIKRVKALQKKALNDGKNEDHKIFLGVERGLVHDIEKIESLRKKHILSSLNLRIIETKEKVLEIEEENKRMKELIKVDQSMEK